MTSLFPRWPGLRLLTGSMLFNLASGCFTITLGQALFEKSGSVSAFTGIVVIEYLVPVLLGAVAGSMADRVNPAVVCAVASIVPALALMGYTGHAGGPRNYRHSNRSHRQPHPPVLSSRNLRGWAAIPGSGRPPAVQHAVGGICSGGSDRRWSDCGRVPLGCGAEVGVLRRRHRIRSRRIRAGVGAFDGVDDRKATALPGTGGSQYSVMLSRVPGPSCRCYFSASTS